jgi:hypothetical protein
MRYQTYTNYPCSMATARANHDGTYHIKYAAALAHSLEIQFGVRQITAFITPFRISNFILIK